MAQKTPNYNLNKPGYEDFGDVDMLNENFEKIDKVLAATDPTKITAKAEPADGDGVMIADSADGGKAKRLLWSSVKTALGKLFVPLARKINGKALSADVTLTGDDIAMGADDAESLRAAMAKRAVGSAVLPDNVDLDTVTVSGMYRLAAMELPWQAFSQMLVVHGGADTISQVIFAFSGGGVYVRTGNPTQVGGPGAWRDWKQLAVCAAPEVHELPLAAGWTKFDATCRYYKTQESVVIVSIAARTTQSFRVSAALATLPEGFRPAADLEVPAIFKGSRRLVTIKATADGNLFVDLTDQSGAAITSDDYFFATFAFVAA